MGVVPLRPGISKPKDTQKMILLRIINFQTIGVCIKYIFVWLDTKVQIVFVIVLFYTALSLVQNIKYCINTMWQPTSSSFQHGEHHHLQPGDSCSSQAGKTVTTVFGVLCPFLSQVLSSFLALLPGFTGGAAISYAAVALPFYLNQENESGMVMTQDQASWFSMILLVLLDR